MLECDDNYPVEGDGIVKVRFKLIPGEKLKRPDGYVYREDYEDYCNRNGLRPPNAAEALLPVARDKQLGRGERPLVMFVSGSREAFLVRGLLHERFLNQDFVRVDWYPRCLFLAVCE